MLRLLTTVALAAFAPLALSACGDDGEFRTDRPILRVSVDEYRIVPQNIVVKSGRMKFVVRNTGRLTHNLVVQIPKGPEGKPVDLPGGRTDTMQPGETAPPIKVTLLPGEYRVVCTIANHDDLGQYGMLKVEP